MALLASIIVKSGHVARSLRRSQPYRFVDQASEVMFVENVAETLCTSVDFVRRIPRSKLPAAKIGLRVLYLRADVVSYIRAAIHDEPGVQRVAPSGRVRPRAQVDTAAVLRSAFKVASNG